VRVETWESFIFVNLDQQAPALEDYLGDLLRSRAALPRQPGLLCSQELHPGLQLEVYVDNYLDGGYHVPHLHKALNSVLEYTEYTIETANTMRFNRALWWLRKTPRSRILALATCLLHWLYPNFMINIYQGVMDTNLVLPLERTAARWSSIFSSPTTLRKKPNTTNRA